MNNVFHQYMKTNRMYIYLHKKKRKATFYQLEGQYTSGAVVCLKVYKQVLPLNKINTTALYTKTEAKTFKYRAKKIHIQVNPRYRGEL